MRVIAAPGLKVPQEHKPRDYITDVEPVEVPDSAYTLRRIADGDLIEVAPTEPAAPAPTPAPAKPAKK